MSDNKRKKKADGKRVALKQEHERLYLQSRVTVMLVELRRARYALTMATDRIDLVEHRLRDTADRLRAGFPAVTKGKRRGK